MIIKAINTLIKQKALYALLFLTFSLGVAAQNISLKMENKPLSDVLAAISQATDYKFVYSDALKEIKSPVTINCSNKGLKAVLDEVLRGKKISYKIDGKNIALSPENVVPQKTTNKAFVIKGIITDNTGELLPGVAVQNKRTNKYTAADLDGNYQIEVAEGDVLLFTSIGMASKNITISGKSEKLNVVLNQDAIALEDVVVTGYQTLSKERSSGSYAVVTSEKIQNKLQTNVIDRLEGMIAGLNTNRGKIEVRGVSTINGTKDPLYVVDGVPFEGEPGVNASPLDVLNPSEIVNVTVLKDATAASIYGARSANGVIVITTRSGYVGKTKVSYNGSVNIRGMQDRDYSNTMSSSELVDYQIMLMDSYPRLTRKGQREWQNDVQVLLLDKKEGKITQEQFDKSLVPYRNNDRYDQVVNEFMRKQRVVNQHNLSFSGGSDIYKYSVSANYTGTAPYEKAQYENRIGFNIKNTFDFFKWLQVDAGVMGSQVKNDWDNGVLGNSYLNSGGASYLMFRDSEGNPLQYYSAPTGSQYKSQFEIDRLNGLGLQDETFVPVNELGTRHYTAKQNYLNLNIGAKIRVIEGLNINLRYQTEQSNGFTKQYDSKDSYVAKRMINDATQMKDGIPTNLIPVGGQILQRNLDNYSYTLRGQIDYTKDIKKDHYIQALAGAEVRKVVTNGNAFYRLGYDDDNLGYSEYNALNLTQYISGTEAIGGGFSFSNPFRNNPAIAQTDNRYVSFYANASYSWKQKLTVTASVRMDQSNLFGTDPKYQYRPLWSAGAHYVLLQNYKGWLDRLVVRATYGINGNIPKLNGPYLIAKVDRNNYYTNENAMYIDTPPNPTLRWEKTKVFNIGVDFNMFSSRLTGSIEFYNKNTTDLLGPFTTDPTLGWGSVDMNFGSMYNRGVELSLNSVNINHSNFRWTSNFVFSYNKNEITDIETSDESAYSYYKGLNNRIGYPMGAMFSVRYKGLNEKGYPVAYNAKGEEILNKTQLTKEDLVYSGTYNPPYNASLTNTFSYKGIDLSFMFIYSGGHVMRDIAARYCITSHPIYATGNTDRGYMNYWKQPGDEKIPGMNPAYMFQSSARNGEDIWKAADKHVKKGDYIKLRDLTLAYNLPAGLLKKTFISGVRFSFQARNLWYWAANDSGLDPEVWSGSSLSPSRGTHYPAEFTFGLNLNF
ncbi:MAG: SusC/RagA family TonB-linked outer membrane protein [Bacteroidales bacterium]